MSDKTAEFLQSLWQLRDLAGRTLSGNAYYAVAQRLGEAAEALTGKAGEASAADAANAMRIVNRYELGTEAGAAAAPSAQAELQLAAPEAGIAPADALPAEAAADALPAELTAEADEPATPGAQSAAATPDERPLPAVDAAVPTHSEEESAVAATPDADVAEPATQPEPQPQEPQPEPQPEDDAAPQAPPAASAFASWSPTPMLKAMPRTAAFTRREPSRRFGPIALFSRARGDS